MEHTVIGFYTRCDSAFLEVRRRLGSSAHMTGRNGCLCLEEDTQEQGSVVNISGWKKTGPTTVWLGVHE